MVRNAPPIPPLTPRQDLPTKTAVNDAEGYGVNDYVPDEGSGGGGAGGGSSSSTSSGRRSSAEVHIIDVMALNTSARRAGAERSTLPPTSAPVLRLNADNYVYDTSTKKPSVAAEYSNPTYAENHTFDGREYEEVPDLPVPGDPAYEAPSGKQDELYVDGMVPGAADHGTDAVTYAAPSAHMLAWLD